MNPNNKEPEKGGSFIFYAVANYNTSTNFGGGNTEREGEENRDQVATSASITGSVSFDAYLDCTGMLYSREEETIENRIVNLHKLLIDETNKTANNVTFFLGNSGEALSSSFTMKSISTTYEMMSEEGEILRAKISLSFAEVINNDSSTEKKSDAKEVGNQDKSKKETQERMNNNNT